MICICSKKLKKFNESNIFKFQRFFRGVCFGTAAFDKGTFQRAILYQNEGIRILYPVIEYFVCGVNRFRVMIDLLRDGSACPVFFKTLPFSGLNGDMFEMFHMSCTK